MASDILKAPRKLFRTPAGVIGIVTPMSGQPYLFSLQGVAVRRLAVLNTEKDAERLIELLSSALPEAEAEPSKTESYVRSFIAKTNQ